MTKEFEMRVVTEWIVDTKKYRYILNNRGWIMRMPIEYLDTTRALDGWEAIKCICE